MSMVHSPSAHTQPVAETPVVGQWAVIAGSWREEVSQITKVSDKQIRTARHGGREAHHRPEEIVFSGTEKQALDLASVLKGLNDRHDRNKRQLIDQHRASRAAAIQKARTAVEGASVGTSNASEPKNTPANGDSQ
jgi:hypothetical protein